MSTTPRLAALLADGVIRVENGCYVGTCDNGQEVTLGVVGYEDEVEEFLIENPTPEVW